MNLVKSESAVSPVIGTILLVAITVVLVAIIAAVVMGMAGNTANTKEVGLTVTPINYVLESSSNSALVLRVTIHGGRDVSNLRTLNVSVAGSPGTFYALGGQLSSSDYSHPRIIYDPEASRIFKASEIIGQSFYYTVIPSDAEAAYENALCTVTGTFADGTSAVLYQTQITYHTPEETSDLWWDLSLDALGTVIMQSPILT